MDHDWRASARRGRTRAKLGGLALVATGILSVGSCLKPIARDLTERTHAALSEAGFTALDVSFKGREGTIRGVVGSQADLDRVKYFAEAQAGVRYVDVSGVAFSDAPANPVDAKAPVHVPPVVEVSAAEERAADAAVAQAPPEQPVDERPVKPAVATAVSLAVTGRTVTLTGVVPSQDAKDEAGAAAASLYGAGQVDNQLRVKPGADTPKWLGQLWGAFAALKPVREPRLSADAGRLELRGNVETARAKVRVGEALTAACPDLAVANELRVVEAVAEATETFAALMREVEGKGLYFESNSFDIKPAGAEHLDKVARLLHAIDTISVRVAGHTDSTGVAAANRTLSQKRANSVKRYLVSKGVEASRLSAFGYGERRPVASNRTEEGKALNRRIEFVVRGK